MVYYAEIALEYSKCWVAERPSNPLVRRILGVNYTPSIQLGCGSTNYLKSLLSVGHDLSVSHRESPDCP